MNSKQLQHAEVTRKLRDTNGVEQALKKAAREAILEHAREGRPIVIWRDGKIVIEEARIVE
jgi:hypothetical protein